MPSIELRNICQYICRDVNLKIRDKELMVILGPNGAGKTTIAHIIAGLTDYQGSVLFDGVAVDRLPANRREVGYLFQDLVLFPHLDVAANIAYGLTARKQPPRQVESRVKQLLQMMKIEHLAARYPKHLSGGEKQRVALARSLAPSPRVMLLDEPLSSLDVATAKYLRTELKQLQQRLGITTVYVTHDLQEAEEMADRIAVIQNGCLEQVDRPERVFFYPRNEKVSDFIGAPNILDCDYCRSLGKGVMEVGCGGLPIIVPHDGESVHRIALLPTDIHISETHPPGPEVNRFQALITSINPTSETVRIGLKAGKLDLLAGVPHHIFEDMSLAVGKEVFLILKLRRIRVYENKDSQRSGPNP
jgi:ABC-type Fe3+/spermidine/putrescine transport system ATPase subunit